MLKITTTKKRPSHSYFQIIALFVLSLFLFQLEAHAQDLSAKETTKRYPTSIEVMIKSSTTDQELEDKVINFRNEHGLQMKVKKVKRDKSGLIKTIHIILSDEKGSNQVYDVSEDEPIQSFAIFLRIDENKEVTFGFNDARISLLVDENSKNQRAADSLVAAEKEATAVKKLLDSQRETNEENAELGDDYISLIKQDKQLDYTKAYISLNGKEITSSELDSLDPETIGSVSVVNSKNNSNLVAQYGDKAQYGVILIETLFILKPLTSAEIEALPTNFKLDVDSGAFIIDKASQDSDIEFYKKNLAKVGVTLHTTGIERGANGTITAIKVKLDDELQNVKMSNWIPFKNANGIENIFVGRQNGKINISTR